MPYKRKEDKRNYMRDYMRVRRGYNCNRSYIPALEPSKTNTSTNSICLDADGNIIPEY